MRNIKVVLSALLVALFSTMSFTPAFAQAVYYTNVSPYGYDSYPYTYDSYS